MNKDDALYIAFRMARAKRRALALVSLWADGNIDRQLRLTEDVSYCFEADEEQDLAGQEAGAIAKVARLLTREFNLYADYYVVFEQLLLGDS